MGFQPKGFLRKPLYSKGRGEPSKHGLPTQGFSYNPWVGNPGIPRDAGSSQNNTYLPIPYKLPYRALWNSTQLLWNSKSLQIALPVSMYSQVLMFFLGALLYPKGLQK